MNVLRGLKSALTGAPRLEGYVARNYAFKSNLKIKWVRPERIPSYKAAKSGDLGIDFKVTPNDLALGHEKSKELQDADEIVKKLFTLEFLPGKYTFLAKRHNALSLVKRHQTDWGSTESRIATMTTLILQMQERMEECDRNVKLKVSLKELIDKRKKYLGHLRKWDYRRFEWVLERLNLIYKPHPSRYLPVQRKDSLRKLTNKHCNKLIKEKLNAYRDELSSKQKDFFKEKAEKLAFIRQEEIDCGLAPTVSEEEIEEARKKYESFQ